MTSAKTFKDNYELISLNGIACNLGFGSYGSVQLAKGLQTGKTVAVKRIYGKLAVNEVQIHYKLSHPNIVQVLDFYFDEGKMATYLVLQYAQNGTLFDFVREHGLKDKKLIKSIFSSVCDAIQYMHRHGIMHRDIKPENILLDKNNKVKLCDFGFAASFEPRTTTCGTVQYMSPEMILRKKHNHKIDIWSLGILLFELIQGHAPFRGQTQDQILEKMKKPLYFSNKFNEDQIQLIHCILKVDPRQRPEAHEILNFPYFTLQKRFSEEKSKRSTMDEQNQLKIKITGVKQLIYQPQSPPISQIQKRNSEHSEPPYVNQHYRFENQDLDSSFKVGKPYQQRREHNMSYTNTFSNTIQDLNRQINVKMPSHSSQEHKISLKKRFRKS